MHINSTTISVGLKNEACCNEDSCPEYCQLCHIKTASRHLASNTLQGCANDCTQQKTITIAIQRTFWCNSAATERHDNNAVTHSGKAMQWSIPCFLAKHISNWNWQAQATCISHTSFQTCVCCIHNKTLHMCLPTPVAVTPNRPRTTSNKSLLSPPLGEDVSCCNCAFALLIPSFTPTSPTSTASVSSTPPTVVATAKRPAKAKMLKLPDPEDNQPGDEQCRREESCKVPSNMASSKV